MAFNNKLSLQDLIRSRISLGKKSPKDFEIVKCAVCNDYKERAGFKFENDVIVYKCFNCKAKSIHKESSTVISNIMKKTLMSFGISESDIDNIVNYAFFNKKEKSVSEEIPDKKIYFPPEIDLPANCESILTSTSIWAEIAKEYLSIRKIDINSIPFYISTDSRYEGRLIVPCFYKNKVIFWQGRALDESIEPRYKNTIANKDNVFFNMDEIYRHTTEPLFVCEGWTDAVAFGKNGVSIMGSDLTFFKEEALKKVTNRKIIFIIDKNEPGYLLGKTVLKNNWNIYVFDGNIDDANDSIIKMGKLWTVNEVMSNNHTGFSGNLLLESKVKQFCKKNK